MHCSRNPFIKAGEDLMLQRVVHNDMRFDHEQITNLERIFRLNIINSVSGIKPANLIGTRSSDGVSNVAIFSSVIHLGSDPALLGMIVRPAGKLPRNTYENIRETGVYTINHITPDIVERAHYTSAKFPKDVSEFETCGLTEEYVDGFKAPFVQECPVKLGMQLEEEIPIVRNDTILLIGSVKLLIAPDDAASHEGHLDLEATEAVGISGLNSYYRLQKFAQFPYARPDELPEFE
jgi:flavin reductase (DIM6/NTAB) family NADH-FMN oxidoreductase RutF